MLNYIETTFIDHTKQIFEVHKVHYFQKTKFQQVLIFTNKFYGKVLVLDNVLQITEYDEYFYNEAIVHIPSITHGNIKKVLIIGSGAGGALREVLRYSVTEVVLIEIDQEVIKACSKYLPDVSKGGFNDPRTKT